MKIHNKFCEELGELRRSTIGDIVVSLGIVKVENGNILNLKDNLFELEQIFYTVDYLKKNELVYVESQKIGSYIPDFNPENFMKKGTDKYLISQMHAMPGFLKNYWGLELVVNPIYYKFIYNGYKTDGEIDNMWNRWLPFLAVILASVLTAVLTSFVTMILTAN
jgi:hypothetical protein